MNKLLVTKLLLFLPILNKNSENFFPKIFLKYLSGSPVPEEWKGGLLGIDYTIGGTFSENCKDCYVKLETHNYLERKLSPNVMGYIRGAVEPDR